MFNNKKYYLEATKEFESGSLDEALWSKSLAVNQGSETKAKYSYINQRAKELNKEAVRKSFSNNLGSFKRPFFILVVAALIIFGIIKTIDYIQIREERAAYALERAEYAEKVEKAYIGFNCKEYRSGSVRKHFSFIMNHLLLTLDYVYEGNLDGVHFPSLEKGKLKSRETYYSLDLGLSSKYLNGSLFWLDKTTLQIKDKDTSTVFSPSALTTYKCVMTDHNEIRERVRKEQQEIRSGYKDFPN